MDKLQSIIVLLMLVALAFSPWVYMKAKHRDRTLHPTVPPEPVGMHYLRERLGRHMYASATGWSESALADYDRSPALQAMWQAEAGYKIAGR